MAFLATITPHEQWRPPARLLVTTRAVVLAMCVLLTAATGALRDDAMALVLLALVAVAESLPVRDGLATRLRPVAAAVLVTLIITIAAGQPEPLLPGVLSPIISAGLLGGIVSAVIAAGFAMAAGLMSALTDSTPGPLTVELANMGPFLMLTVAIGGLAAWVRSIASRPGPAPDPAYAAAYRLLSQLRTISRSLHGGLDAVSLASGLLESLSPVLAFDRAVLLVSAGPGGRLVPLARQGEAPDQLASLAGDHPATMDAWLAGHTTLLRTRLNGSTGSTGVLVLRAGIRSFGTVVFETPDPHLPAGAIAAAEKLTGEASLRLETALLFSEVRSIATAEERHRVAREVHDGIAQEVAALGYAIDELTSQTDDAELRQRLRGLREEVTRVVGELRLSIFDLRSDVRDAGGLGPAVSDCAQQVGATSAMTVHLELDEAGLRLPMDVEAELLRIVQEALTNARKHSGATNLWVTCRVAPPAVHIVVADDGVGLGTPRPDSYGLKVMRERADRVGATLTVTNRPEGGTRVEVRRGAGIPSPARALAVEGSGAA